MIMSRSTSVALYNNAPFFQSLNTINAVNILGLTISAIFPNCHYHLDLLGTGAFALAALPSSYFSLNPKGLTSTFPTTRTRISATAVVLWSLKLSSFLFYRALKVRHDSRLSETLATFSGSVMFWFISYLWNVIVLLPFSVGSTSTLSSSGDSITMKIGCVMWAAGFIIESLADYQKWRFKSQSNGGFFSGGLFKYSQHPNYFGNLLLWTGVFVMNATALIEPIGDVRDRNPLKKLWACRRLVISMLSPLFLYGLFTAQANGSMTNAVSVANKKYGNDPSYLDYKQNVPLIFPKMKW